MKKILSITTLIAAAVALNVGCTASAGIHGTSNTKTSTTTQVAYVTAPAK